VVQACPGYDLIGEVKAEQQLGGGQQPLRHGLRAQIGEEGHDVLALFRGSENPCVVPPAGQGPRQRGQRGRAGGLAR
jgi:hypothetical protein